MRCRGRTRVKLRLVIPGLTRDPSRTLPLRLLPPPLEIPKLKLVMQWNRHNDQDAAHAWLRQRLLAVARVA